MIETVSKTLSSLKFGEPQTFQNFTLFPVLDGKGTGPEYLTLGEALRRQLIRVSEMSEAGSVPELKVMNLAEIAVLLLDGEELVGAKQNRVLNATILLKSKTETIINVSCTERGRWHYQSREFADSDVVMARNIRARKNRSVSAGLRESNEYRSDQGEIWEQIDALSESAGVSSRTAAMRDVFVGKEKETQECLQAFTKLEGQVGFVFVVDGTVAGMDFVSRTDAYFDLHNRLVKSYVIDSAHKERGTPKPVSLECVRYFVEKVSQSTETSYPSTGCGNDFRFEHHDVCGSALVYEDVCVHAAFFTTPACDDRSKMRAPRHFGGSRTRTSPPEPPVMPPESQPVKPPTPVETEEDKAAQHAARIQRIKAREASMATIMLLDPLDQLERIANDVDHPVDYYPQACAEIAADILSGLTRDAINKLRTKLADRRTGPWLNLARRLDELDTPQQ